MYSIFPVRYGWKTFSRFALVFNKTSDKWERYSWWWLTHEFNILYNKSEYNTYGSIFGKRYLLAIDHIVLALFWSYVPNMK